jgi:ABC-2 type transport system ATP-binding protein
MIHVKNLTKYYNDFCAVDQINLDIEKGEVIGLLGPNGAGKTTTLRMLTGYFAPTAGDIRIKDFSINEDALAIKQMIGYLPESAPLYKGMLVYDYLDHIAQIRGLNAEAKSQRLNVLADMCGLRSIMHKTIETLSKGLKQRVGLAHAMMSDPEILILDEPTSGLDPNQIVEIREIIRKIGQEKTVILSTHILSEAEATCDRIVIINKGRIIADGSTQDIKQRNGDGSSHVRIELEQADFDEVRRQLESIDAVRQVERISDAGTGVLKIKVACHHGSDPRARIYEVIKSTDWVLIEMHREAKTLETIFRELTMEN